MSYCEFYDEKQHTARKEHTCEMCGGKIKVGEKYWNEVGKYEGEFFQETCTTYATKWNENFVVKWTQSFLGMKSQNIYKKPIA